VTERRILADGDSFHFEAQREDPEPHEPETRVSSLAEYRRIFEHRYHSREATSISFMRPVISVLRIVTLAASATNISFIRPIWLYLPPWTSDFPADV